MSIDRRSLLMHAAVAPLAAMTPNLVQAAENQPGVEQADYTISIGTGLVELAPDRIVSTTLYNGQFPGLLLRLTEGKRVVVDIHNETDTPEQLHWHGQFVPVDVDGGRGGRHALRPTVGDLYVVRRRQRELLAGATARAGVT